MICVKVLVFACDWMILHVGFLFLVELVLVLWGKLIDLRLYLGLGVGRWAVTLSSGLPFC